MIDLSTCIPGQKVFFQNGQIGTVSTSRRRSVTVEMQGVGGNLNWSWYTLDGIQGKDLPDPEWEIVEILPVRAPEEQPMIDLSTCAYGQKVKYRNGATGTFVGPNFSGGIYPFLTRLASGDTHSHTKTGSTSNCRYGNPHDILEILPVETPAEQPTPKPQEMDYKSAYLQIANIVSVAFPECEVTTVDMARLLVNENRTLRLALGLPTYEEVENLTYTEVYE